MLGIYFLIVFGLMFVHWGLVIPKTKSEMNKHDWVQMKEVIFIFGTMFCFLPPIYILISALIYVYKKGVKKYEKNSSDS